MHGGGLGWDHLQLPAAKCWLWAQSVLRLWAVNSRVCFEAQNLLLLPASHRHRTGGSKRCGA